MGVTDIHDLPYPESDANPDVPADMKALAEKLDTEIGGGGGAVVVTDHGAVGDGVTDDTTAILTAIAALEEGGTLVFPAGMTFRHTNNLPITGIDRVTVTGGGTVAHDSDVDSTCALEVRDCYGARVSDLTLTSTAVTRRADNQAHRLFLFGCKALVVSNVTVAGAAGAGILLQLCTDFRVEHCQIMYTLADSLHMTHACQNGVVDGVAAIGCGDDGVAVVSYASFGSVPCSDITIKNCYVADQSWGRGFAVVGGERIRLFHNQVDSSAAAGLYIAAESSFDTLGVSDVQVSDLVLRDCVQQADDIAGNRPSPGEAAIKQGTITVLGRDGYTVEDVSIHDVTITGTHPDNYNEIQLLAYTPTAIVQHVDLTNIDVTGTVTLFQALADVRAYNRRNIVENTVVLPDEIGFVSGSGRDGLVTTTGGALTGPLSLARDPSEPLHAATKQYVDAGGSTNPLDATPALFAARYTKIAATSTPVPTEGVMSIEEQVPGNGVWVVRLSRRLSTGINLDTVFDNIESLGYWGYAIYVTDEDGNSAAYLPNQAPALDEPYDVALWYCKAYSVTGSPVAATGPVRVWIARSPIDIPNDRFYLTGEGDTYFNASGIGMAGVRAQEDESTRWFFGKDDTTETGADLGSNWVVRRFSDTGVNLGNAITVWRDSGTTEIYGKLLALTSNVELQPNSSQLRRIELGGTRIKRNQTGVDFSMLEVENGSGTTLFEVMGDGTTRFPLDERWRRWTGTQAEYDALGTWDAGTLYVVT